jgi:hypothetical protein
MEIKYEVTRDGYVSFIVEHQIVAFFDIEENELHLCSEERDYDYLTFEEIKFIYKTLKDLIGGVSDEKT